MKLHLLGLFFIGLLSLQRVYAIFGWFESSSAVSTFNQGASEILKNARKQLDKLAENASKLEQAEKAAAKAQQGGLLGSLDSIARATLQGAWSCGATAIRHPSLLLLGTGLALYASPRLRSFASRGLRACFGVYAGKYPNSYFVRAVNTVGQVWNRMNPEAVVREQVVAEQRRTELVGLQQHALLAEQRLGQRLDGLTTEITHLQGRNKDLEDQLPQEKEKRLSFNDLGQQVVNLNAHVDSVRAEVERYLQGTKDHPGILTNIATLFDVMNQQAKAISDFNNVLAERFKNQIIEVKNFVEGTYQHHQSSINTLVDAQIHENTAGLLKNIAELSATMNVLQEHVGGLRNTFGQLLQKGLSGDQPKATGRQRARSLGNLEAGTAVNTALVVPHQVRQCATTTASALNSRRYDSMLRADVQ